MPIPVGKVRSSRQLRENGINAMMGGGIGAGIGAAVGALDGPTRASILGSVGGTIGGLIGGYQEDQRAMTVIGSVTGGYLG